MARYYCTDKRGQVTVESATTIIDTDERVANFFEPTPDGYRKAYDANGLPSNELIPPPTQAELDEAEIATKWGTLATYLATLTVTTTEGNKFDVSPTGLANITQRVNTMTDVDTDVWYEDWGSFTVNKVKLQEALIRQAEAKKAKITELFEAV